ncbi:hypothetical protein EIP91_000330 [Steccherinum ochraceum]|uniref:Uncharacterized protein n=1 Tax=Steccherinum ochraceum TaxID=92696 RepID=A0A4R0RK30_9APHY|nr:hypothetical protein EIP91_000330 [Steccherinum ochraceum]
MATAEVNPAPNIDIRVTYAFLFLFIDHDPFPNSSSFYLPLNPDSRPTLKTVLAKSANPALPVEGLGTIGLPLGEKDAKIIKYLAESQHGSSKKRKHDAEEVGKVVTGFHASLVKTRNLDWEAFLTRIVGDACTALGINSYSSHPRCELHELLLYDPGTHSLPRAQPENVDGTFAKLLIFLPSESTGGSCHLSHDGISTVYDFDKTSVHGLTAIAWRTGVTYEIKPLTSGSRFALAYNLVHTTTSPPPALVSNAACIAQLRQIVDAWEKSSKKSAPRQIVYLLKEDYRDYKLSVLRGEDAQKVSTLAEHAKTMGFHVGLSSVLCEVDGYATKPTGSAYPYHRAQVGFSEVLSREASVWNLVDLDGKKISESFSVEGGSDTIPANLAEIVESGTHDDQDYDGDTIDEEGSLTRWYSRTVMGLRVLTLRDSQSQLERCLGGWDFNASFSFDSIYEETPSLALQVEGLGQIGLPLVERDALTIKDVAQSLAGPSKERRRTKSKVQKGPWEIDGALVKTENPAWQEFLSRVTKSVYSTLNIKTTTPLAQRDLHKLVLYGPGSQLAAQEEPDQVDGHFATLVVVLPSKYTGGAAHLSHEDNSICYDHSGTSAFQTAVMAWYTGVAAEVREVTSGYQLALVYNLVQTATSPPPSLDNISSSPNQLREILHAWKLSKDDVSAAPTPRQILWLLEHKYSGKALHKGSRSLKGMDARKLAVFSKEAQSLGFHLGLANVVIMLEESSPPDESDFDRDGESGSDDGYLSRWHSRTVIVAWPHHHNFAIRFADPGDPFKICEAISRMTNKKRTSEDAQLVDLALDLAKRASPSVAKSVCNVALLWKDLPLWRRAVHACSPHHPKGLAIFEDTTFFVDRNYVISKVSPLILDAISAFGFRKVQDSLDIMVKEDKRNSCCFQFLDALKTWAMTRPKTVSSLVLPWVESSRDFITDNLRSPYSPDDDLFISLALENGGLSYLTNHILPQVMEVADGEFLRDLVVKAFNESGFQQSSNVKSRKLSEVMRVAIGRADINTYDGLNVRYGSVDSRPQNLNYAVEYFQACLERFDHLIPLIFDRVLDTSEEDGEEDEMYEVKRVERVLLPLLDSFLEEFKTRPKALSALDLSAPIEAVIKARWRALAERREGTINERLQNLTKVAALPGGSQAFATLAMPRLKQASLSAATIAFLVESLRSHLSSNVLLSEARFALQTCIDELNSLRANPPPPSTKRARQSHPAEVPVATSSRSSSRRRSHPQTVTAASQATRARPAPQVEPPAKRRKTSTYIARDDEE